MQKKPNNPPKASIKRNTFFDEEIFGTAYDQKIVKRFGKYLKPFKKQIIYAIIAVIFFSISSVLLPLIVKYTIDSALIENNTVDKTMTAKPESRNNRWRENCNCFAPVSLSEITI